MSAASFTPETGHYGIQSVPPGTPGAMTCGDDTCARSWVEDITPAGRCPWEDDHTPAQDTYDDTDACVHCMGIVPPDGVTMVPDDGELCSCPLAVWLKFDDDDDDDAEPSHEANIFHDVMGFRVEWSHTAVGLISSRTFYTFRAAREWLTAGGYDDYTA